MRIALVHSFYRSDQPSGENVIVQSQAELLQEAGHDVVFVAAHSDETTSRRFSGAHMALDVMRGTGQDPTAELLLFAPDVVHIHNLFPNFSTRWLANWSGRLVSTFHNFRPMCANALLLRDGQVCTLCPDGHRWAGTRHRCYRDSTLATLPLTWRNRGGATHDPLVARSDALIVLSDRARDMYLAWGVPLERLHVIPNGVPGISPAADRSAGYPETSAEQVPRWVSVGRLNAEKGLVDLMRIWPNDQPLDIIGDGDEADQIANLAPPSVKMLGSLPRDELRNRLASGSYSGSILAGLAIEGAHPLTAIESMAAGIPLVARIGGAGAVLVDDWNCGATFELTTDSLARTLTSTRENSASLGRNAILAWKQEFSPDAWIQRLLNVYQEMGEESSPSLRA